MPRTGTEETFGLLWKMPLILIFLAGGFLQYTGILSQTQSNWLALVLFSHVFLAHTGWRQLKYEVPLIIFLLFITLDYFRHSSPISYTVTYFYYIVCTIIAAVAGRVYALRIASSISTELFFNIVKVFLFIQLIAVTVQRVFTEQFISFARVPIGYIDAIFGTFFLQSDASLAAVCELLTISTFLFRCRLRDRFIVSGLSLSVIFLVNSNAAKAAIILIFALLLAYSIYRKFNIAGRYGLNIVFSIAVTLFIPIAYSPLLHFLTDFFAQATNDYYHRGAWQTSARFSPMGQMFAEGIHLFGRGALTYYNPITKRWLYNAGFSTVYSLYLDFGLIGLLLYCFYQFNLVLKFARNYFEFVIFMCVFVLFMTFNFALTDLAFVFTFNMILRLNYLRGRSSSHISYKRTLRPLNIKSRGHVVPRTTG
ncbi:hypothetical protein EDF56_1055 [Novosphingobium sp. PhB165]|uniref:hypothetical protein n=1 Tax=Novosphingobium sp. PhB165 TaxID=2485105 RepID=UPI0010496669|nr:hypothetical protein [Novosphingobium sp. PhB165]TCM17664.1 hypothetical protein EDF56_1055 [Novosphingobium sp. PhB165]